MWAEGQECGVQTDAQRKVLGVEPEDSIHSGRNTDLDIVLLLISREVRLTKLPRPEAPNSASSASDEL